MNPFVEKNLRLAALLAPAPGHAGVADEREQPGPAIAAFEAIEKAESPQVRLLRHVFSVMVISHQPAGEIISCIQMRENGLFKKRKLGRFSHFRLRGITDRDRPRLGRDCRRSHIMLPGLDSKPCSSLRFPAPAQPKQAKSCFRRHTLLNWCDATFIPG